MSDSSSDTGPARASAENRIEEQFGRFQQVEFIGQGGMARVYKAYDPGLDRFVALKLIRGDDPELSTRLLVEAKAQARIDHENVCRVYEVGDFSGRPYIAMQYIQGRPLGEFVNSLSLEQKVRLLKDIAEGVHAAHRAGTNACCTIGTDECPVGTAERTVTREDAGTSRQTRSRISQSQR